jgi:hypothetical protein
VDWAVMMKEFYDQFQLKDVANAERESGERILEKTLRQMF